MKKFTALLIMAMVLFAACDRVNEEEIQGMNENSKVIIDFLACDYILLQNEKDSAKIFDIWKELYEKSKKEGFTPVVIAPSSIFNEVLNNDLWGKKEDILSKAEDLFPTITADMRVRAEKRIDEFFSEFCTADVLEEVNEFVLGGSLSWIERDNHTLPTANTFGVDELLIVKIPTENAWEVAAWVSASGYYAPNPSEQVALFKSWYERFGAVPALVSYDVWLLYVPNPPQADEDVIETLKEAYAFCFDAVEVTGSFPLLALPLKYSNIWGFWWD